VLRDNYPDNSAADFKPREVVKQVLDALALEMILGFGAFEEVWAVRYEVLPGDPAQRGVWDLLDGVLTETYRTDAGRELRVRMACVDSGGHHQHQVLTYCRNRIRRGVLPIKGIAGPRPIWPARSSRTKSDARIFMAGVDTAKDAIYSRLRIGRPGPGYIHFPIGGAFDETYFTQLTAETVQTRFKEGRPYRVWVLPPGKRNEALDTAVYALAARHATRVPLDLRPAPIAAPAPDDSQPNPPQGAPQPVSFPPDMPPPSPRGRGRVIVRSRFMMGE
jgi:phage terminase large subunit GpA-like protein